MEKHHQESIYKFLDIYKNDSYVLAILLGGSLAHGFAQIDSDIDVCIIVETEEYLKRKESNKLAFSLRDICTYQNGYIDCKVVDLDFLFKVSKQGSDPSRYAFKDNKILFSRINNLPELLADITAFPKEKMEERRKRFASQVLAWKWFYSEGVKNKNSYLIFLALQKIILFSSRIILNENRMLYPFHKWMLKELETAENKPGDFLKKVDELFENHSPVLVNDFCKEVFDFIGFNEQTVDWPNYFLKDSEQTWIEHEPAIDDL